MRDPRSVRLLAYLIAGGILGVAVAAAAGAQAVVASPAAAAGSVVPAAPEAKRGKLLYIQCRACHELKAGLPHKVGPNLHGFIGRASASASGFSYSAAMKAKPVIWDRVNLEKWLEKPSAVIPGNTMAFAGIASPKDRAALIAYLEAESK